ncbi:hypothetical protein GYMLUDRAFT_237159 [Collybiopsis luxurians FD-317 M1]|nr:hypothetical protein GYMLUDRAFT_237159 [Collybiopsis luxurians FD-317 M1]
MEIGIFAHSPKLQVIEARTKLDPTQDVLSRITKLPYDLMFENLHEILSLCSNLHNLVVNDYGDDDDEIGIPDLPIVMPTLTSLHVEGATDFEGSFHSLTTPALSTLEIDRWNLVGDATLRPIEQFLDRTGCSLTSLMIKACWTDNAVIALLRRLPSLQELTILDHTLKGFELSSNRRPRPITKLLVESLHSYQQSHSPFVPKLHSLSLKVALTGFDHKSFVEVILSRWIPDKDYAASIGVSCIQSVELRLPEPVDEAEYLVGSIAGDGFVFHFMMRVRVIPGPGQKF